MNKIEKLKEINKSLNELIGDLETKLFIEKDDNEFSSVNELISFKE